MSIEVKNLSYKIDSKYLIKDISFKLEENKILTVIGPNGAGKSTLIKLLSGDMPATEGTILFDGKNLDSISIQERAFIRSVMSQSQEIVFDFSVEEVIEMGWLDKGNSEYFSQFDEVVDEVARECSIGSLLERSFSTLSGGEKKRVHFARTLIQLWRPSNSVEPRYMFLDEPNANLDILYEVKMMKLIQKKKNEGVGIVLILHDLNLAAKFSDTIAIVKGGSLIDFGSPQKVLTESALSFAYELPMVVETNPLTIKYY